MTVTQHTKVALSEATPSRSASGLEPAEPLHPVIESLRDAVIEVDRDFVVRSWNRAAARLYGVVRDDAVGRPLAEVAPLSRPLQKRESHSFVRAQIAEQGFWRSEEIHLRRDDTPVLVELTITERRDPSGWIGGYVLLIREADDKRSSRIAAFRANERFRNVFDNAPIGMALTAPGGRFVRVNHALAQLLGRSQNELTAMTWQDVTHPADRAASENGGRMLRCGRSNEFHAINRFLRADGSTGWCRVAVSLPKGTDGVGQHAISQVVDITNLVETEQHLRKLLNTKNAFVAAISHELRTPLTGVLGFASELRDRANEVTTDDIQEQASFIAQQAQDLAGVVDDLLTAARTEAGTLAIRGERVNLRDQAQKAHETATRYRTDTPPVSYEGEQAIAWADPLRVQQILRNLIGNALCHGKPPISIKTHQQDDRAQIQVIDTGKGVPAQRRPMLFQAFNPNPMDGGSTGIGLYVSQTLAELMSGTIKYARREGQTTFTLDLPTTPPPTPNAHTSPIPNSSSLRGPLARRQAQATVNRAP